MTSGNKGLNGPAQWMTRIDNTHKLRLKAITIRFGCSLHSGFPSVTATPTTTQPAMAFTSFKTFLIAAPLSGMKINPQPRNFWRISKLLILLWCILLPKFFSLWSPERRGRETHNLGSFRLSDICISDLNNLISIFWSQYQISIFPIKQFLSIVAVVA